MRKIKITIIISLVLAFVVGCNDHPSSGSSGSGTSFSSDDYLLLYNISGDSNEKVTASEGSTTFSVTPKWGSVVIVEDSLEINSTATFTAFEISPGQQAELYTLIRSYWELSSDWMPNLNPGSLREVEDLDLLMGALICSVNPVWSGEIDTYLDIDCPDYFIPSSLFREIATSETSFTLDYPGQRIIFVFYE